ncbi:MAG: biotin/lipoyl-binding protein [Hyphomicrobiales bacterium]|nr:biotin/lipoyl-binding protein [Hyphomicrobiales bacterium]
MNATPFTRLFIANRGEVALRIMRTAQRMGLSVFVALPGDEARDGPVGDHAVVVRGENGQSPYLDGAALVAAALACGAEAVHPGYGFLAESADFAEKCRDAGLIFVGPDPASMRQLGNKGEAKALMRAAGLACIEGYAGEDQAPEAFGAAAQALGFPVMIKAKAGGGGRGMRLVAEAAALPAALAGARLEAEAAFGDGALMLERAITRPRHIEVQVFGDRYGHLVHLFERDCSVQRRHQKIIEEAPAPNFDEQQRQALCEGAVRALAKIGYEGAGTMEFLVDAQGRSFFMEMNTRLQVEHQVTEQITGVDLVEWQLRVAMGEALPRRQPEISRHGHALEVRLCAEDPAKDFLPQTGEMAVFRPAPDVLTQTALRGGDAVSGAYDSLIAKIVTHGASREEARRRLMAALDQTFVLGVVTNRGFLARCLADARFVAGKADTSFLDHVDAGAQAADAFVLALLLYVGRAGRGAGWPRPGLGAMFAVPLRFECRGAVIDAEVMLARDGEVQVSLGAATRCFRVQGFDGVICRYAADGVVQQGALLLRGDRLYMQAGTIDETCLDLTLAPPTPRDAQAGDGVLRAALGGRIVELAVREGQSVAQGDIILVIEAMKMQHAHRAGRAGTLTGLRAHVGQQVREGDVLALLGAVTPAD